jgi:predicted  nucleic acid-binding Zn-ribbon protein
MRIDDLPGALKDFTERAEAVVAWEVERAKKAAAALNAEKTAAEKMLADIRSQHGAAEKQLKTTLADLDRASSLSGLNYEIGEAKKTLEKLKAEVAKTETAFEAVEKQRVDEEHKLVAVRNEAQRLSSMHAEATTEMNNIRALLKSFAR